MNDHIRQLAYAAWRLSMWTKGYGSYTVIDEKVATGELVPGQEYPETSNGLESLSSVTDDRKDGGR